MGSPSVCQYVLVAVCTTLSFTFFSIFLCMVLPYFIIPYLYYQSFHPFMDLAVITEMLTSYSLIVVYISPSLPPFTHLNPIVPAMLALVFAHL